MRHSCHHVWITRGGQWAREIAGMLKVRGITSVVHPVIDCVPVMGYENELQKIPFFDWLIVTSSTTAGLLNTPIPQSVKVAAVGRETAESLIRAGHRVSLCPENDFSSDGLASAIQAHLNFPRRTCDSVISQRILILTSDLSEGFLKSALERMGHKVTVLVIYKTVILDIPPMPQLDNITAAFVTSGSIAQGIAKTGLFFDLPLVCIGHKTAEICQRSGLRVASIARTKNKEGLVQALFELS